MKICKVCGVNKPISEYHSTGYHKRLDEVRTKLYKPECKACALKAWGERMDEKLGTLVPKWECRCCGYNKYRGALEFHHVDDATKDFTISSSWTRSFESLKKELDKCVLLCCICHREVHAGIRTLDVDIVSE